MRFLCLLSVLMVTIAKAQVSILIQSNKGHGLQQPLYLAGSFNGWNPADSNFRFVETQRGYELKLPNALCVKGFACKVTAGTWERCEGDSLGQAIGNRQVSSVRDTTLIFVVKGWEQPKFIQSTISPRVKNHTLSYHSQPRSIWVYVPKEYDLQSSKRYSVVYLLDGQNIFDNATAFAGEWGVDETMDSIEEEGGVPSIVVAIEHGGESRLNEYTPFSNTQYGGGGGKQHATFVVNTVKPFVDSVYRTQPEALNTAIGGSSLGGLMAMYISVVYPQKFGKAAIFSPAFWWSDSVFAMIESVDTANHQKWCLRAGTSESKMMLSDLERVHKGMIAKGVTTKNLWIYKDPNGQHNEAYWKRMFKDSYCWLFAGNCNNGAQLKVDKKLHALIPVAKNIDSIRLLDTQGQTVQHWKNPVIGEPQPFSPKLTGNYLVRIFYSNNMVSDIPVNLP
jgi:predicted alpha/beta superfamily hydrolase